MAPAEIARALDEADAERRRRAVVAMSGRAEPALGPLLMRALGDQDWRVREEAIRVGRELALRIGMISPLLGALDQGDNVGLRNAALALLKLLGGAAIGPLTTALPDLPPGTRKLVIEVLAQRGDTQVLKMLSDAADAADLNLATAAIEGLAAVGGAQAEAVLRTKLKKSSPFLRIAALDALDKLAAIVPWEELEPLLSDRMALRVAVRALGRSGRREAIPALLGALGDRTEAVAGSAAIALACLVQNDALREPLQQQLAAVPDGVRARLRALATQPGDVGVAANLLLAPQRAAEPVVARKAASAMLDPRSADARAALFAKGPRLELEEFRTIAELIRRVSGIKLTDELRATIERRLTDRLSALAITSFADYQRLLRDDGRGEGELERAIELITTNETYFFRDLPQLRSFEREVVPELHKLSDTRRTLSIWSAGCSTGEEAYTIAILLARSQLFSGWNVRVFGNDISRRVVQTARKGIYRGASFRALPPEFEPYFTKTVEGAVVDPAIRALCHFARFNLLDSGSAAMFGRVDAIFCRNVLIYFDDEARRKVIDTFYERLNPGGYLMLGHSDSLLQVTTAFELAHLSGDLAYRKPLAAGHG
jgi:chemotaxis protein methyltransferase CheR